MNCLSMNSVSLCFFGVMYQTEAVSTAKNTPGARIATNTGTMIANIQK